MTKTETAEWMGYGTDTEAMDRVHDMLHYLLCAKFGVVSQSMRDARGEKLTEEEFWIACFEEDAVLNVQRWLRRIAYFNDKEINS